MSWKKERDLLIAQTMAFVQSVTGRRDDAGGLNGTFTSAPAAESASPPDQDLALRPAPKSVAPIESLKIAEAPPPAAGPAPRPVTPSDMASEIRARVESFRAHQERFNREREQYFTATLQRLRTAIKDASPPPHLDE